MELTIKGLKHMDGPDGLIFRASVYVNGKRRFVASNDGNGGCHLYTPIPGAGTKRIGGRRWIELAEEWARTLPSREVTLGEVTMTVEADLDQVIDDLINEQLSHRWLKGQCRNKTLFRTPDMPEDEWKVVKHPYNDQVRDWIHARYPGAEIANESL